MAAKFGDQDPAVAVEQFEDSATTFFVEHWNRVEGALGSGSALWRISFYSVLFRLSTGKRWDGPGRLVARGGEPRTLLKGGSWA